MLPPPFRRVFEDVARIEKIGDDGEGRALALRLPVPACVILQAPENTIC